jgi:hypothetical protein
LRREINGTGVIQSKMEIVTGNIYKDNGSNKRNKRERNAVASNSEDSMAAKDYEKHEKPSGIYSKQ